MLLSAYLSKRFRASSGSSEEKNGFVSFIAKASTIGILLGVCCAHRCFISDQWI